MVLCHPATPLSGCEPIDHVPWRCVAALYPPPAAITAAAVAPTAAVAAAAAAIAAAAAASELARGLHVRPGGSTVEWWRTGRIWRLRRSPQRWRILVLCERSTPLPDRGSLASGCWRGLAVVWQVQILLRREDAPVGDALHLE